MTKPRPVVTLSPDTAAQARQGMPQFFGISAASAGSEAISMNLTAFGPGGRAKVHYHRDFETAIYGVSGRIALHWGAALENACLIKPGTFCFIPPHVPHVAFNLSLIDGATAISARNDPAEQENVVMVPELDQKVDALVAQYPEMAP